MRKCPQRASRKHKFCRQRVEYANTQASQVKERAGHFSNDRLSQLEHWFQMSIDSFGYQPCAFCIRMDAIGLI